MKDTVSRFGFRFGLATALMLVGWIEGRAPVHAALLTDFGYRRMTLNGQHPLGTRPLVVILVNYADGSAPFTHDSAYFDSLIFDRFGTNSSAYVNGFFQENSLGRFAGFSRAGILGPLNYTASQHQALTNTTQLLSNILYRAMALNTVNFDAFDANGDRTVTDEELEILVVNNDAGCCGANFYFGCVRSPNFTNAVCGTLANVNCCSSLATFCHELTHGLGDPDRHPVDLYGAMACLSVGVTLMSCTCPDPDGHSTIHLDAWHKMQLGWAEPRIRSLRTGGVETLPAVPGTNASVILYDPLRGTNEFFLMEYRTKNIVNGSVYDTNVSSTGLAIWQVQHDAVKNPVCRPCLFCTNGGCDNAVFNLAAPDLSVGQSQLWTGGLLTPFLTWLDGTVTSTRIYVRPFATNSAKITVEWWSEEDTWVDFAYTGFENGTFSFPYNTLGEGVAFASYGGNLNIKPGSTRETATINKRLLVRAVGGPVTIGR